MKSLKSLMSKLAAVMMAVMICVVPAIAGAEKYTTYGVVQGLSYVDDTLQVVDLEGNVWYIDGVNDLWLLDYVELTINNKNTVDQGDDVVLSIQWTGTNLSDRLRFADYLEIEPSVG